MTVLAVLMVVFDEHRADPEPPAHLPENVIPFRSRAQRLALRLDALSAAS